jgi:hypothetical protein
MSPTVRRFALSIHLTCSVGWIGAVIAYLALGLTATFSGSPTAVRGAWAAMEIIGWYVLVPLALGSWFTGLVMSLGTRWGLFRYYWVLVSFALTSLAVVVLLMHMPDVSAVVKAIATTEDEELDLYGGDLFHAATALVLLLLIQVLNVYKPPGMTPYGWRRSQRKQLPRDKTAVDQEAG